VFEPYAKRMHGALELLEPLVVLLQPLVDLLEPLVDLLEPLVNQFEPLVESCEPRVHSREAGLHLCHHLFEHLVSLFPPRPTTIPSSLAGARRKKRAIGVPTGMGRIWRVPRLTVQKLQRQQAEWGSVGRPAVGRPLEHHDGFQWNRPGEWRRLYCHCDEPRAGGRVEEMPCESV
jgi:hypothetical protein